MTTRFAHALLFTIATLLVGTHDAHAQLGMGGSSPPTPPTGASGGSIVIDNTWSAPPAPSQPARWQASATIHAHEVFGGTRATWQRERSRLDAEVARLAADYRRALAWARQARGARERSSYDAEIRRLYDAGTQAVRKLRHADHVLSVWYRPTTFYYFQGRGAERYPVISDPYSYLRRNPQLFGSEVTARHPGY